MPTYKVAEFKTKKFLRGRMTGEQLEAALNEYAAQGWTLDRIVAGETARFMGLGEKDVFLVIFQKD